MATSSVAVLPNSPKATNRYLEIRNASKYGSQTPPAELILYGNAVAGPVDYLRVRLESACSGHPFGRVRYTVELWHWPTMDWRTIASTRYFGYVDEVGEFEPSGGFSEYVDPLGREVRCRIRWRDTDRLGNEWSLRVDEASLVFGTP